MLHHIATISVCYGGHFESKMTAKIQKSSDLGEIWYYYRHDRVKNWALMATIANRNGRNMVQHVLLPVNIHFH
jgi:hypothetical protein